jgi:amidophosphoribosyltransferase
MHPCHFGVDMGHDGDLMAARLTQDEMRERVGAGQPRVPVAGRDDARRRQRRRQRGGYCNACFTGRYPLEVGDAQAKLSFEGVLA